MEISADPSFSISTRGMILSLEFSPYEWSRSLLAVAHSSSIAVYSVKFKEETEDETIECKNVWECHISSEPTSLSWSPASSLRTSPKCIELLVATASHTIFQMSSDLKEDNILQKVMTHTDNINDVVYSGDHTDFLAASVSDDLSAKVWHNKTKQLLANFLLTSPGISLRFHPEDPDHLLVGEKCGTLRIYSISGNCAKLALRSPSPLLSVDWSILDPSVIVSAGPQGITVWNIFNQQPAKKSIKVGGGDSVSLVSLSRSTANVVATISIPNSFRIFSLSTNKVPVVSHLKVISGISWHLQYPYAAVASDSKIHLWKNDCI